MTLLLRAAVFVGLLIGGVGFLVIKSYVDKHKRKRLCPGDTYYPNHPYLSRKTSISSGTSSFSSPTLLCSTEQEKDYETSTSDGSDVFYDCISDNEEDASVVTSPNYDSASSVFKCVDKLLRGNDDDRLRAHYILQDATNNYWDNADFHWRMAQSCCVQATAHEIRNDNDKKKQFVFLGMDHAKLSLSMKPSNYEAHKWYAILLGMKGKFTPMYEKIESAKLFCEHLMQSLRGKPNDPILHHTLGRIKYEIANMIWYERKVAETIFKGKGINPNVEDALRDFKKCEELSRKPWKENKLFIAKCYLSLEDYPQFRNWLNETMEVISINCEDIACDDECHTLLHRYRD